MNNDASFKSLKFCQQMQMKRSEQQLNDASNSLQQNKPSSAPTNSTASTQSYRLNKTLQPATTSAEISTRSNQSLNRSTVAPVPPPLHSSSSKEKQIDSIRQRMESCLTAITNKVCDKGQKSPHGPFLAYLGTKLPSVPKEHLPRLEREILDIVASYST